MSFSAFVALIRNVCQTIMWRGLQIFNSYLTNITEHFRNVVGNAKPRARATARRPTKPKVEEPVILTLSSDEEDDSNDISRVYCHFNLMYIIILPFCYI